MTTQDVFEKPRVVPLQALDWLEESRKTSFDLKGATLTEARWRPLIRLVRFDPDYVGHI